MSSIKSILQSLKDNQNLSAQTVETMVVDILQGDQSEAVIAALLMGLATKGEVAQELIGAARAMRKVAKPFSSDLSVVDNCGTGGVARSLLNSSTAAAIVAAAAGAKVAKHGNRSNGRKSGSADLLEALGMPLEQSSEAIGTSLEQIGFGFFFAPAWHPAMRFVGPVRKQLMISTLFNLLGPLCNPAQPTRQVIGAVGEQRANLIFEAGQELGFQRLIVVYSQDGLDDVSPSDVTHLLEYRHGMITQSQIHPETFGLNPINLDELAITSPQESSQKFQESLDGWKPGAQMVAMNAALTLYASNDQYSIIQAGEIALETIHSGLAKTHLKKCQDFWGAQANA